MALSHWLFSTMQLLSLGSFQNWFRLLLDNPVREPAYLPRVLLTSLLSLATSPLRLYERLRYGPVVDQTALPEAPIFILGHWRSGTTLLHNLLSQDRNLGYVSTLQTIAPEACLAAPHRLRAALGRLLPPTRLMDNMAWSLDSPQEEEYAIANLSPYSFYHMWSFPRRARELFTRYVLFNHLTPAVRAQWNAVYLGVLGKATLRAHGRRLVVKNTTNTGRLPALLALFPDARFIHIVRNPYLVFASTLRLYHRTLPKTQLQGIHPREVESNVLLFYRELMQRYLADRACIPAGHLVEVNHEALEADPLGTLRRIYEGLGLPGYGAGEPAFRAHLHSQRGFRKNRHRLTGDILKKVQAHWGFALAEWGYAPPAAASPGAT